MTCPPYETADGYLQTTEGCSHNHCLFCTYFKDRKFRKSTIEEIEADIKQMTLNKAMSYNSKRSLKYIRERYHCYAVWGVLPLS